MNVMQGGTLFTEDGSDFLVSKKLSLFYSNFCSYYFTHIASLQKTSLQIHYFFTAEKRTLEQFLSLLYANA